MPRTTPSRSRLARLVSAAMGFALLSGGVLASAAPASAVEAAATGHTVSGTVSLLDANGVSTLAEDAEVVLGNSDIGEAHATTAADGTFSISNIADGVYDAWFDSDVPGYEPTSFEITVAGADLDLGQVFVMTRVPAGTVEITGELDPGATLTAVTDGWPAGTSFKYYWWKHDRHGRGKVITEGPSSTLTIHDKWIGHKINVDVKAEKAGFAANWASAETDLVRVPEKPAAPAPVADSAQLDQYLEDKDSYLIPAYDWITGIDRNDPPLDPAQTYQGKFWIASPDSFVDVYVYSSPVLLGTFPVSDKGYLTIDLGPELLSQLGPGEHTLVAVGQSSGTVKSGEFRIASMLAATGVEPVAPLAATAVLLVLGVGALIVARRRAKA